jgi:hypothetical protein
MRCTSGSEDLFECNMLLGHKSLTASQSASTAAKSKVAARIRITKIVSSSPYWPESSKSAAGGGGMRTQTVIEVGISLRENRFGQRSRCRSEMTRVTLCRNTFDVRGSDMRQGERALTFTLLGLERAAADSHRFHQTFIIRYIRLAAWGRGGAGRCGRLPSPT